MSDLLSKISSLQNENSELKLKVEQLESFRQHAYRQKDEISALLSASKAILINKKFIDAAKTVFDSCKKITGATAGYVALLSPTGEENEVLFLDAGGMPCTVDPELPMPIRGLREECYKTFRAVYDNKFWQSKWTEFMPEGHVELKNVMFAPLIIDEKVVGLIGLANKKNDFTDEDAVMAAAFAELAAIALRNSLLVEELDNLKSELKRH